MNDISVLTLFEIFTNAIKLNFVFSFLFCNKTDEFHCFDIRRDVLNFVHDVECRVLKAESIRY